MYRKGEESVLSANLVKNICTVEEVDDQGLIESMCIGAEVDLPKDPNVLDKNIDWKQAQLEDPVIGCIWKLIEIGNLPSVESKRQETTQVQRYFREWDKLLLKDGVLFRKRSVGDNVVMQLILPYKYRQQVFQGLHCDIGHMGRDRTVALFQERFFWPGMCRFVEERIKMCDRCIRSNSPNLPQSAPLVRIQTVQPMQLVCIDFLTIEDGKGGVGNVLVITDHFTKYS
jgi:hypothetical protein